MLYLAPGAPRIANSGRTIFCVNVGGKPSDFDKFNGEGRHLHSSVSVTNNARPVNDSYSCVVRRS
jgi:hypothetical protein